MTFPDLNIASIFWNMDPAIINSPIAIRWYGLLFALGLIAAYQILTKEFKKLHIPQYKLDSLIFYLIIAVVVGARLGHCFFYEPEIYLKDPIRIFNIREGGLASHGAAIGIIIAMILYNWRRKEFTFISLADVLSVSIPVAAMAVRIGNFMNSEIVGKAADVPWAVIFARNDLIPRHPGQLYEAIAYFFMMLLMLYLFFKKEKYNKSGFLSGVFLIGLFTARFLIEFVKEVQVDFETTMFLHMGQWLSLPFIILGILLILYSRNHFNDFSKCTIDTKSKENKNK